MTSRSLAPGAINSNSSASLEVAPLRDALTEVATDAASVTDVSGPPSACRLQASSSTMVSVFKKNEISVHNLICLCVPHFN